MQEPQTTAEFWDEEHTKGELLYLSGYPAEGELHRFRATELVRGPIDVGCEVSILNISRVALNKFANRVAGSYVPADQFAVGWDQNAPSIRFLDDVSQPMPYCRSLGWMSGVVEDAGGAIVQAETSGNFPEYQFGWYTCHAIRGKTFPSFRPTELLT